MKHSHWDNLGGGSSKFRTKSVMEKEKFAATTVDASENQDIKMLFHTMSSTIIHINSVHFRIHPSNPSIHACNYQVMASYIIPIPVILLYFLTYK